MPMEGSTCPVTLGLMFYQRQLDTFPSSFGGTSCEMATALCRLPTHVFHADTSPFTKPAATETGPWSAYPIPRPKAAGADIYDYPTDSVRRVPLNQALWDAGVGNWCALGLVSAVANACADAMTGWEARMVLCSWSGQCNVHGLPCSDACPEGTCIALCFRPATWPS
jgi:hypothetical protein